MDAAKARVLKRAGFEPRLVSGSIVFSRILTTLVLGVAVVVLLGWVIQNQTLKGIGPGLGIMNPMTAVLFILSAISLVCLKRVKPVERQLAGKILAGIILTVASLKLLSFIGLDIYIDQWLFTKDLMMNGVLNKMAPNTAVNFILVAFALLWLDKKFTYGRWWTQYVSILSLAISFTAILGYAYSASYLHDVGSFRMALNTSITFVLVNLAILFLRPEHGVFRILVSSGPGGRAARNMLPWAIEVPSVLGYLRMVGENFSWYGTEVGITIFVCLIVLIFSAMIWISSNELERVDRERRHLEEKMRARS